MPDFASPLPTACQGSCGNLSAGVGLFALGEQLVKPDFSKGCWDVHTRKKIVVLALQLLPPELIARSKSSPAQDPRI